MQDYVERNAQGALVVAGTRVSLGSVVGNFLNGESPEAIQEAYPTLTLAAAYGAVAYYLANRAEIDAELAGDGSRTATLREQARQRNTSLRSRLLEAKAAAE